MKELLEENLGILVESRKQAQDAAWLLQAEIAALKSAPLPNMRKVDLAVAEWKVLQQRIEFLETAQHSDPMELANLIGRRQATEQTIWAAEFAVLVDLLLTHESLAALRPVIEEVYAAGVRAGVTESIEHFLISVLASADGIRPTLARIVEAQDQIAARLGIPA